MKKKIIILATAFMLTAGSVVSAAAIWGQYKGYDIVRITVDGKTVKGDVPAINFNGRTLVPIYMLKEAGVNYKWEDETRTVAVTTQKNAIEVTAPIDSDVRKSLTAKEIAKLSNRVGYVESYDYYGEVFGSGSGFMIKGGYFITNSHVGHNAGLIVKLDGITYDNLGWYMFDNQTTDVYGTFLSTSYDNDGRSTGTIPTKYFDYITTLPEIGDKIFAIGSPKGLENSISEGIVSGLRTIDGVQYIQHTADIDHGSSGGVLLNEYGEAIGVNSSGFEGSNLEFAVPMKYVQDEINKLK